jgi:mannose-6-phosphate isomerase-like protein (cupin superfamily)
MIVLPDVSVVEVGRRQEPLDGRVITEQLAVEVAGVPVEDHPTHVEDDGVDPSHDATSCHVRPAKRLSYQRHMHRTEHWFVISGHGVVTLDGSDLAVAAGSAVDVPAGTPHRIANDGVEPLVFIEVQIARSSRSRCRCCGT